MKNFLQSWVAIVAILAVTLLGAVAINTAGTNRDRALARSFDALCEQQNLVREKLNQHMDIVEGVKTSLDRALLIASRGDNQTKQDQIDYSRLRGRLDRPVIIPLPYIDCKHNQSVSDE